MNNHELRFSEKEKQTSILSGEVKYKTLADLQRIAIQEAGKINLSEVDFSQAARKS
ncbi:hypothetical protein V8J88_04465 [Massilia sp. W12]|uniref:hypothetical protein n=1 Tax=Massilia sp. W12 TaxID=3126507 RepID=UPI0030CFF6EF